ncbi:MAG: glycine cleavage system protein R [Gammaproteobacteria bacterium]|nr:glycine cleavage system protein R [Gammaproteobacteria bacterium]
MTITRRGKPNENHLVVAALGHDHPGLVKALSQSVLDAGCNISDSRMTVLGNEFALIMLLSGTWNAIAKIEDLLPKLQEKLGLTLTSRRTESRTGVGNVVPYAVEVVAMDHPGIVHDIANFFSERSINVEELYTTVYQAPHTGAPMFSLHMTVAVPGDHSIAALRGEFMDFCDALNLDAMLAPVK